MAGPAGQIVGRVNIRVAPDTSKFAAELRAQLKKINEDLKIDVGADTSKALAEYSALKQRIERDTINADVKLNKKGLSGLTQIDGSISVIHRGLAKVQNGLNASARGSKTLAANLVSARQATAAIVGQTARWIGQMVRLATTTDAVRKAWSGLSDRLNSAVRISAQQVQRLAALSRHLADIASISSYVRRIRIQNFVKDLVAGSRAGEVLVRSMTAVGKAANKINYAIDRTFDGLHFATATFERGMIRAGLEFENLPRLADKARTAVVRIGLELEDLPNRVKKGLSTGIIRAGVELEGLADKVGSALRKTPEAASKAYRGLQVSAIRAGMAIRRIQDVSFSGLVRGATRAGRRVTNSFQNISSVIGKLIDGGIKGLGTVFSGVFTGLSAGVGVLGKVTSGFLALGPAILNVVILIPLLAVMAVVIAAIAGAVTILIGLVLALAGAIVVGFAGLPAVLAVAGAGFAAVALGIDGIKEAAKTLTPEVNRLKASLSKTFQDGLTPVFEGLKVLFPEIQAGLNGVAQQLVQAADGVRQMITSSEGIQNIKNAFSGIQIAMDGMAPGLQSLLQSMLDIAGTEIYYRILGDTISSVAQKFGDFFEKLRVEGTLADGLIVLWQVLDSLTEVLLSVAAAATDFFVAAGPGIANFFNKLADAINRMDWTSLGQTFGDMFNQMANGIANIDTVQLNVFLDSIGSIATSVADFAASGGFTTIVQGLALLGFAIAGVMDFATGFINVLEGIITAIPGVGTSFTLLKDQIKSNSSEATGSATADFQNMWSKVEASTDGVGNSVSQMNTRVSEQTRAAGEVAPRHMGDGMNRMVGKVNEGVNNAGRAAGRLPGEIRQGIGPTDGTLVDSGRSLINGFIRGIRSAIGAVRSAASAVVSTARQYFPFSPAKKGPFSGKGYTTYSGRALVKDWAAGIESATPYAVRAVDDMVALSNKTATAEWEGHISSDGFGVTGSVYSGVMAAFDGSKLQVDGNGMAKLVNKTNSRNMRR